MNKINRALSEINELNTLAQQQSPLHQLHPLAKLLTTICYIALLMSFGKYQLLALTCMGVYPFWGFHASKLSWQKMSLALAPTLTFYLLGRLG